MGGKSHGILVVVDLIKDRRIFQIGKPCNTILIRSSLPCSHVRAISHHVPFVFVINIHCYSSTGPFAEFKVILALVTVFGVGSSFSSFLQEENARTTAKASRFNSLFWLKRLVKMRRKILRSACTVNINLSRVR